MMPPGGGYGGPPPGPGGYGGPPMGGYGGYGPPGGYGGPPGGFGGPNMGGPMGEYTLTVYAITSVIQIGIMVLPYCRQ